MHEAAALPPPLSAVLASYRANARRHRRDGPGRPKKLTDEYMREILVSHQAMRDWFISIFGAPPRSDRELYERRFANHFAETGLRSGRSEDREFRSKLKTYLNHVSAARTWARTQRIEIPGNPHFREKVGR